MEKILGFKIDVDARTVEPWEYQGAASITKEINCFFFDCVRMSVGNIIYVDDNGLATKHNWFAVSGYPQPLRGNGIILGYDRGGETISSDLTIEQARELIHFPGSTGFIRAAMQAGMWDLAIADSPSDGEDDEPEYDDE